MELTESKESVESDIEFAMYSALEATISSNVDAEVASKGGKLPFPKEVLVSKIIQKNMDQLEEELYMTLGRDGKVYLAGPWLMRPLLHEGKMVPTMDYLKSVVDTTNVIFVPNKTGADLRKELWQD